MKRLIVSSLALILLTGCSIQKELNTYQDLPEFMRLKYIEEHPSVVIHQDACNVEIETVFGIGYAWGRCSDINEDKLTYGNYLDYLPTDEENFYLQKRDETLNYCEENISIEAFTELLKDKKTINIPVQYMINIHNSINLDSNQTVDFFAYNEDKTFRRRYNIEKYTKQGFYLKIEDAELVDGRYMKEKTLSFTYFVTEEFYPDEYVASLCGF